MKTPTWSYVVGIIMMLFGGCDTLTSLTTVNADMEVNYNEQFAEGFEKGYQYREEDSLASDTTVRAFDKQREESIENVKKITKDMFVVTDYTTSWIKRFGYIGIFVAVLYLLGGLFLMIPRKFSIPLVYLGLIVSIAYSIIKPIIFASEASLGIFTILSGFSGIFSVIIDAILLIVVLVSNKEVYRKEIIHE